jgi:hypothetical protein
MWCLNQISLGINPKLPTACIDTKFIHPALSKLWFNFPLSFHWGRSYLCEFGVLYEAGPTLPVANSIVTLLVPTFIPLSESVQHVYHHDGRLV